MAATHKGRPETAARPGGPAAVGAAPKPGGSPASAGGEAPPSSLHLSPRRLCTAPLSSPGSPRRVQASLGVAASGARQGARSSPFPLSRPHAGPVTARLSEPTNERAPPGRGRAADGRYPTGPAAAREAPSPRRRWLRRDAPRVAATAAAAGRFRGATSVGGPAAAGGRGQGREGRAARPGGGVEAAPPTAAAKGAWAGPGRVLEGRGGQGCAFAGGPWRSRSPQFAPVRSVPSESPQPRVAGRAGLAPRKRFPGRVGT